MAGQERLVFVAQSFKGFQLAGAIQGTVSITANIERYDADRVTGNEKFIAFLVVESKGKDTAQPFDEIRAITTVEGEDDLAVTARLKLIFAVKVGADVTVVVYFTVYGQNLFAVG